MDEFWRELFDNSDADLFQNHTLKLPDCVTPGSICGKREESQLWYVGVIVSIIASILSNFGVNTQKYSMIQEIRNGKERSYTSQPIWMLGLLMVILGAIADFGALGFAAQSLITPVGGFTMVANLFFASYWLGETITRLDLASTALIIFGVILVAAFADKSSQCFTLENLMCLYKRTEFISYAVMIISLIILMYLGIAHIRRKVINMKNSGYTDNRTFSRWRKVYPLMCASLSGLIGAQSVLFAKSSIEILKSAIRGNNEFAQPATYMILAAMLISIFGQIHWLAVGLKEFDAVIMVPVFQCVFVVFTIIGGAAYFDEFRAFNTIQTIMFPLGVLILVVGVLGLAMHKSRSADEMLDVVDTNTSLQLDLEACNSAEDKSMSTEMNGSIAGSDSIASSDSHRKRSFLRSPISLSPRSPGRALHAPSNKSSSQSPTNSNSLEQRRESVHRYDEFNRLNPYGALTGRFTPFMLWNSVEGGRLFEGELLHDSQNARSRSFVDRRRSSVPSRRLSTHFKHPLFNFRRMGLFGSSDSQKSDQQQMEKKGTTEDTVPSLQPPNPRHKSSSFAGIEHLLSSNRSLLSKSEQKKLDLEWEHMDALSEAVSSSGDSVKMDELEDLVILDNKVDNEEEGLSHDNSTTSRNRHKSDDEVRSSIERKL